MMGLVNTLKYEVRVESLNASNTEIIISLQLVRALGQDGIDGYTNACNTDFIVPLLYVIGKHRVTGYGKLVY